MTETNKNYNRLFTILLNGNYISFVTDLESEKSLVAEMTRHIKEKIDFFPFKIAEMESVIRTDQIIGYYSRPNVETYADKHLKILEEASKQMKKSAENPPKFPGLPGDEWKGD